MAEVEPLPVPTPARRPVSWSRKVENAIIDSLRKGASLTAACAAAGVARRTCYSHLEQDEDWRHRVDTVRESVIGVVEQAVVASAVIPDSSGRRDVQAMKLLLYNRAPDRYAPERVEVSGDLMLTANTDRVPLTDKERRTLQVVARQKLLRGGQQAGPEDIPY